MLLQGAAVGRPVIAGDTGGAPEAVIAGENGFTVDPTRIEPVAEAILGLLRDPARAEGMGRAGARWLHAEWTWEVDDRTAQGTARQRGGGLASTPRHGQFRRSHRELGVDVFEKLVHDRLPVEVPGPHRAVVA